MKVDRREYLQRVRALLPQIDAAAVQIDRDRRIPQPIVDALHDAGLFRLLLPRSLGGVEIDPVTFVEIMEAIGGVDASTAWCLCQTNGDLALASSARLTRAKSRACGSGSGSYEANSDRGRPLWRMIDAPRGR